MILILLPAYNESSSIDILLSKIKATMETHAFDYLVLILNDGSHDGTLGVAEEFATQMPLEVISHRINRGLWETVRDGFEWAVEHCKADDIIIRMDADDTHEPKYIPAMVAKINEGYDVVIASRFQPGGGMKGLSAYRSFVSQCANLLMKLFFPIKGVREYSCGYRAYRASVVQNALYIFGNAFIDLKGVGFTCTIEKLIKFRMMNARFAEVPFVLQYDQKKSPSKMLSSITTLGYFVLILKYIYPWGETGKRWHRTIREFHHSRAIQGSEGAADDVDSRERSTRH